MNITVYCGANSGVNPLHKQSAITLGKWIAENNHTLVYGGGSTGLMGTIADAVLENGGKVIGVIPTFLKDRELGHDGISELITVETMAERKDIMFNLGDVFIALPGGAGTLEEITDVVSWSRIGKNDNPCIFYNIDNFYTSMQNVYKEMVEAGFLFQDEFEKILFSDSLEEIETFIDNYTPPGITKPM
ncbi:TIGR00730 family Rossman fold protein [Actinomyces sp. zg-332]|uniref:LOG family protein n=1 Tax=Actinomyces sp. zg-332 TaxID=2708340 RepID=UPI0014232E39|nr:TIGR00730 family Rossman fold protein [Actinomyces sp. zg-332]QPK94358.1 TIGR00730 family Rossman fold protein [Actinomyces sp. zg-332]